MTSKVDFTDQEWSVLHDALLGAGQIIAIADPTSKGDLTREARAIEGFFAELRDQAQRVGLENKLLEALVTDTLAPEVNVDAWSPATGSEGMAELKRATLSGIKQAAHLLDAKATSAEATDIKIKMYQLAGQTAAASKEGSFLGFGGTRVTDAERTALNELAGALGIDPAAAAESWPLPGEPGQ